MIAVVANLMGGPHTCRTLSVTTPVQAKFITPENPLTVVKKIEIEEEKVSNSPHCFFR